MQILEEDEGYKCKLCASGVSGREELVQHLKDEHEYLEVISFATVTMLDEQRRDASALEFSRRFRKLREIISG